MCFSSSSINRLNALTAAVGRGTDMSTQGLRNGAIVSFVVSMAVLLIGGFFAKDRVPPVPERIVRGGTQLLGRDALEAALAGLPDQPTVLYHLGAALYRSGLAVPAADRIQRALDLSRTFPQAGAAAELLERIRASTPPKSGQ